jgi:D-threo-aldose 1-dehydrogenase
MRRFGILEMPSSNEVRYIVRTSVPVTRLGLGTVALGFLYEPVTDDAAHRTIETAFELGLRLFDTAPLYGDGVAETRLGQVLRSKQRDSFTVATKVGFDIQEGARSLDGFEYRFYLEAPHDFSYDGVLRNLDRSLRRLQVDRIDIVHIHDADEHFEDAMSGAYRALDRLRSEGTIGAVSAGMNQAEMLARFAREGDFDCFLLAGRYTLLEQGALETLFPLCTTKHISVFLGGIYNSGILADPHTSAPNYNYGPARQALVSKARRIDAVCGRYGVPIKAAALQFPSAHRAVAAILCGSRSAEELTENDRMFRFSIPQAVWDELRHEGLIDPAAPVPGEHVRR